MINALMTWLIRYIQGISMAGIDVRNFWYLSIVYIFTILLIG